MKFNSLTLYFCVLILFFSCKEDKALKSKQSITLNKACVYLWSQQAEDGGFHSETQGLLKSGQAWTPFILNALMQVPDSIYHRDVTQVNKAVDFIKKHVNKNGVLGLSDKDLVEYPNYSTAYALRCLYQLGNEPALVEKMTNYLLKEQFTEQRGFDSTKVAYGIWGFGEIGLDSAQIGHVDLSHTRRIIETLKMVGAKDEESFRKANFVLNMLQKNPADKRNQPFQDTTIAAPVKYDGGFYFSPVVVDANKGLFEQDSTFNISFASYATATCDGLLARLALGQTKENKAVQDGIQWLKNHPELSFPEGIPKNTPEQWHKVMVFYHFMVRSELYSALHWEDKTWTSTVTDFMYQEQKEDGRFYNPMGELNKEDDPLLATSMAIISLVSVLKE